MGLQQRLVSTASLFIPDSLYSPQERRRHTLQKMNGRMEKTFYKTESETNAEFRFSHSIVMLLNIILIQLDEFPLQIRDS